MPLSVKARCGVGPNDFVPSENSQRYEPIGHCESTEAEYAIGLPSSPENGPSGLMVGLMLFARSGPIAVRNPLPVRSRAGLDTLAGPMLMSPPICPTSDAPTGS